MKYIIVVGDGMADYPLRELNGRTPLEVAKTPFMDRIAGCRIGLARTIPEGMGPGSDVANLSLLGYDPLKYHSGRAPLEAAGMGIKLASGHVAFRMNLVTLDIRSNSEIIMVSHSAGDISTQEASIIISDLRNSLALPGISIFQGVAYRHILLWENGPEKALTIPPHDVLDQNMAPYLNNSTGNPVPEIIRRSWDILQNHPVNIKRQKAGHRQANSIWLWGQGSTPRLPSFEDKYGLSGSVISAVDLIKGIGICAGLSSIEVEGATGYLDTNYRGKAEAALRSLRELDFVFLHIEAPDEAGHAGDPSQKIEAIENLDSKVVGPVMEGLDLFDDYRIMVVSDHLTPIPKKTHTADPTPFAWASKKELKSTNRGPGFSERSAAKSGLIFEKGYTLIDSFISAK